MHRSSPSGLWRQWVPACILVCARYFEPGRWRCMRMWIGGRSSPPPSRNSRASCGAAVDQARRRGRSRSAGCSAGMGGGRTISWASPRWRSMSSIRRRWVSRLIACSAIARAPRGRLLERAGVPGRQHVDALRPELDRVRDRRVVGHAAVHERCGLPTRTGGEDGRDGGAGQDGVEPPGRGRGAAPRR